MTNGFSITFLEKNNLLISCNNILQLVNVFLEKTIPDGKERVNKVAQTLY